MAISAATRAKKSASMKKYNAKKKLAAKKTSAKKKTWQQFMKGKMSAYMKSEGGHAGAMKRLAKEYKEYKAK